jgi:Uncharacterised nucleotidyltransferase
MQVPSAEIVLDRMVRAVQDVRDRLLRATAALDAAGVPYAVVGGNAVAAWVARVDKAAVRNTQDVDILIRRADLNAARAALEPAGFVYRHSAGVDMFLDGEDAKARDAVHVIFANEKVRKEYSEPAPDIEPHDIAPPFRMLPLEALVRMKLTSYRRKDQVHIQDLIGVGLIDESWAQRLPAELSERLRTLLADPDG